MLPDSFEIEAAARLRNYERRIDRLETLEGSGGGGDFILIEHREMNTVQFAQTFSDIPTVHTHLFIIFSVSGSAFNPELTFRVRMNGDAGANYSRISRDMRSNDTQSTSSSAVATAISLALEGNTNELHSPGWALIPDYLGTNNEKSLRSGSFQEIGISIMALSVFGGMWRTFDEAINSLTFFLSGGSFRVGSTISLYGIN